MKKITLLFLVTLFSTSIFEAKAQTVSASESADKPKPSGFISINGGIADPLGDFAGSGGNALTGATFGAMIAFPLFNSGFGIISKVDLTANNYDAKSVFDNMPRVDNYTYALSSSGSYSSATYLIGAYYTVPFKKSSIDFRAMGGIMESSLPSLAVGISDQSGNSFITGYTPTSTASSFAYDIGSSFRYSLSKRLCVMLNLDIIGSSVDYAATAIAFAMDSNGNYAAISKETTINRTVMLLNTTVGLGYKFGK